MIYFSGLNNQWSSLQSPEKLTPSLHSTISLRIFLLSLSLLNILVRVHCSALFLFMKLKSCC
uniref:Uncharacterized protein n=1 Tax=Cannabis sativa TaxID=3483 RepID=A0A803RAH7_CANSA